MKSIKTYPPTLQQKVLAQEAPGGTPAALSVAIPSVTRPTEPFDVSLSMKSARAFTLIELLIVVAIIAILAAIAVPNFLEAQTRAKVSRVKADQRAIATAIVSYTIDTNREPVSVREIIHGSDLNQSDYADWWAMNAVWQGSLSTPVAYIARIPSDPFRQETHVMGQSDAPGDAGTSWSSRKANSPYDYDNYTYHPRSEPMLAAMANGHKWSLFSAGPSRKWNYLEIKILRGLHDNQTPGPYDATNGTKSWGPIMRTNVGPIDAPQPLR